jgi:hypothetical protein
MSENISSNNIYQTQIPSLTDAADIQDAFKLYHFGSSTEPASASVSDGIAGHLYDLDTLKAPIAGPTFTGTLTAPTINASTALQIGGTAITSTAAELNILDGVTSTAAELNLVDGSSAGTIVNSKALVYGSAGQVNATTLQIAGVSVLAAATPLPGTYGGTGVNNGSKTLTISGNTTIGSSTHTVAFVTTANTSVTLPTTGTLATLSGSEALTGKTYNGLTLTAATTGFTVAGGTTSKTLTVSETLTLTSATAGNSLNIGTGGTLGSNAFTSTSFQPLATNLTSIGNLANSAGYLYNNGSGNFSYTTPGDINTTYSQSAVTTTGGAFLRLTSSGAVNDDVKFASSGSTTVSYTDASTITISSTDNNFYPTAVTMTGGSTSGPVVGLTMNSGSVTTATIPSAGSSASGIVTTGLQSFGGNKTFDGSITVNGAATTIAGNGYFGGGYGSSGVTIFDTGAISADSQILTGGSLTRTQLSGQTSSLARFDGSGNLVRDTSSERYKQDISDITYAYADVLALEPKVFRLKEEVLKDDDARTYGGFIAEEVDQIDSLKVFVNYIPDENGNQIPDGINYGAMVSALVSAMKHQDSIIKSLTARIEALEA